MKHTLLFIKLMVILTLFAAPRLFAQTVEINPQLEIPQNPSPYLSDWQSNPQTVMLNTMVSGNYQKPVKLMASCTLNGQVIARTKFEMMKPITLHQGMNTFNAIDLVPYSAIEFVGNIDQSAKRAGRLPEGNYQFCIAFVDAETNIPLPGSACNPFAIQSINPPTLISPANGTHFSTGNAQTRIMPTRLKSMTINEVLKLDHNGLSTLPAFTLQTGNTEYICQQIPAVPITEQTNGTSALTNGLPSFRYQLINIVPANENSQSLSTPNFNWLPPMGSQASAPVRYRLRIVPVLPGQSEQQAMENATPVFEQDGLLTTTFNSPETINRLFSAAGTTVFSWSVQAHDMNGNAIGSNSGWALPNTFTCSSVFDFDLPNNFFDIFSDIELPELCGQHAKEGNPRFGPWRLFKSSSQYFNVWIRNVYKSYEIIDCGLDKGHAGPHQGPKRTVYVLDHTEKRNTYDVNPPPGNPPLSTDDDPSKKDQMSKDDIQKILDNDKPDKGGNNGGANNGGDNNGGNNNGGSTGTGNNTGTGTDNGTGSKVGTATGGTKVETGICEYTYKEKVGKPYFTPCEDGMMYFLQDYAIFHCNLPKGHTTPHMGSKVTVSQIITYTRCDDGNPPPSHFKPPTGKLVKAKEINAIPTKEEADKKEADENKTNADNTKKPCPEIKKTILRTVAGSWSKVSTKVTAASIGIHVGAIATVTFTRDIWTVYLVQHCTLELGHGGPHVWDAGHEEWYKVGTFTKTYVYGVGELQVPPKDAPGNELPQQDPPRGAITH